jgi:phosphoglycolate phosphatase
MFQRLTDYRHIIWDWNGTLLDDAWLCVDVMNEMLELRKLPAVSLDYYRSVFNFPVREYYRKLGYDFDREPFEEVGMEFMAQYNKRQKECKLHPAVVEVLETIKVKGFEQSILSAREQNELRAETDELGVKGYFSKIYGLDDHYAHGKTDVGKKLVADLGIPTSGLLFIGDTVHDAEVACEIGIDCVLIPNGHHSGERLRKCNFPVLGSLYEVTANL